MSRRNEKLMKSYKARKRERATSTATTEMRIHTEIPKSAKAPKTSKMTNLVNASKANKTANKKAARPNKKTAKSQEKVYKGRQGRNGGRIIEIFVTPLDLSLTIANNNGSGSGQINIIALEDTSEE